MAGLWNYLKGLFEETETSSPTKPAVHELIERSPDEQTDYARFAEGLVLRRLRDWIHDQYAIFRVAPRDTDRAIDFLDTPSSKGFVIHFHETQYAQREVTHLFDFLKERVLALDYRTQISDRRIFQRNTWVETVERHYLKPRSQRIEGQFEQRFGNVKIELELRDDVVHNLRFSATIYKDAQFREAQTFRELLQQVL